MGKIKSAMHTSRKSTDVEENLRSLANSWISQMEASGELRDRPSWEEAFMLSAYQAADRSSCRHIWTGAVVVKDKRIIASGYNGAPTGIENCREIGCRKDLLGITNTGTGNCRGAHAERNAMDQIARKDLIGTIMYTIMSPCSDCTKTIVGNQIAEVVYAMDYEGPDSLTKELFKEKGIILREFKPNLERHYLRLKRIDNQRYKK